MINNDSNTVMHNKTITNATVIILMYYLLYIGTLKQYVNIIINCINTNTTNQTHNNLVKLTQQHRNK